MGMEDPTLTTLASYDMSAGEAIIGLIVLATTVLLEMMNGVIPQVRIISFNWIALRVVQM